ncbi:hypothetical protein U9M48_002397 [Paspalum notatum var. saurae]|uniref:Uncharacterized protein n=1 Tax=Paspalum notatum var. saurae TaxID=547442 RepID=A0AAQ3PJR2_PASNO
MAPLRNGTFSWSARSAWRPVYTSPTLLVNLRFGPPIRSNTLGTVEDYQRQFLALLCRCDRLTPQHQIDLFTTGLGQPLVSDVEMQWPANLQTAMSMARAYERRHPENDHAKPATPESAYVTHQILWALVDSGSTHNFINQDVARTLSLLITPRPGLSVCVANRDRVVSAGVCAATPMLIHDELFLIDCYVLALDGFDVVLGVQWLKTLEAGPLFGTLLLNPWRSTTTVSSFAGTGSTEDSRRPHVASVDQDWMQALLAAFTDIFALPQGLPPIRSHDHRIHLLPGTAPVAVRPYHYP